MLPSHRRGVASRIVGTLMIAILAVGATVLSACSQNVPTEMSPKPPQASIDAAVKYTDAHAKDKQTDGGKAIPDSWTRGVLLQEGHKSSQVKGNQWLGVVVMDTAHGNKQVGIGSDWGEENAAKAVRTNLNPGDYVAYDPDQDNMLVWGKTIYKVHGKAVPDLAEFGQ